MPIPDSVAGDSVESAVIKNESGFHPLQDFVLLRVIPAGETKGGIALTGQSAEQYVVVEVGPGRTNEDGELIPIVGVEVGRSVGIVMSKFSSAEPDMYFNGQKYFLVRSRDITGYLDELA